jgi:hypothetical protein
MSQRNTSTLIWGIIIAVPILAALYAAWANFNTQVPRVAKSVIPDDQKFVRRGTITHEGISYDVLMVIFGNGTNVIVQASPQEGYVWPEEAKITSLETGERVWIVGQCNTVGSNMWTSTHATTLRVGGEVWETPDDEPVESSTAKEVVFSIGLLNTAYKALYVEDYSRDSSFVRQTIGK